MQIKVLYNKKTEWTPKNGEKINENLIIKMEKTDRMS